MNIYINLYYSYIYYYTYIGNNLTVLDSFGNVSIILPEKSDKKESKIKNVATEKIDGYLVFHIFLSLENDVIKSCFA